MHGYFVDMSIGRVPKLCKNAGLVLTTRSRARRSPPILSSVTKHRYFFGGFFDKAPSSGSADIMNCGVDLGKQLPQHELLVRAGMEKGSRPFHQQLYGAAMYWHAATTDGSGNFDANFFRDRDVLEVGCHRGGGARYLAEVCGTRNYVATDIDGACIADCVRLHSDSPVYYRTADAAALHKTHRSAMFDIVLCIEVITQMELEHFALFLAGAKHVLRPGGMIVISDLFELRHMEQLESVSEDIGLTIEHVVDISDRVKGVGRCTISKRTRESYSRVLLRKEDTADDVSDDSAA